MNKKVAIIGAGVGGLATAARLASRGYEAEVYEKLSRCGGRANIIEDAGFKFDTGPSFVLMPDFFQEVFSYCGEDINDYLDLKVLDPGYKIFYPDSDILTVYKDSRRTKEELEKFEKGSARSFDLFIAEITRLYKTVRPLLYKCLSSKDLFNPYYWSLVPRIRTFQTYWNLAKKFFKSDKLCYAFTFEAMFIGVSPFSAPAFYSVISYTDHVQKIYHPMGGMYRIPMALEKLGKKFGVKFHYNSEVSNLKFTPDSCVLTASGAEKNFGKIVANADWAYTQSTLLGRPLKRYQYSCSVYLIYLGLKQKVEGLSHHNLFFARDLRKNLDQVFKKKIIPDDLSFYIHVPTVTDSSLAPEGKDILYILVPVPNLDGSVEDINSRQEDLRRAVLDKINRLLGIKVEDLIEVEHRFYPQDFINRYNIKYGATFGLAHNFMQSAFFRPLNYDRRIRNMFFTGASTQPGGGLPPVIASSRIVADLITSGSRE